MVSLPDQIALPPNVREAGNQKEAVGEGVNEAIGNFGAPAFLCDVIPDVVEISRG